MRWRAGTAPPGRRPAARTPDCPRPAGFRRRFTSLRYGASSGVRSSPSHFSSHLRRAGTAAVAPFSLPDALFLSLSLSIKGLGRALLSPSLPALPISLPCPRRRRSRTLLAAGARHRTSLFVGRSPETSPSPVRAPPNLAVPRTVPPCLAIVCSSKVEDNPKF
jgi:hypothetical protein